MFAIDMVNVCELVIEQMCLRQMIRSVCGGFVLLLGVLGLLMGKRRPYYCVFKFTSKSSSFHRPCAVTFLTAKNVTEGLRQRKSSRI